MPEIAAELGIVKSTAYQWVRDIALDADARKALFAREHSSTTGHGQMMAETRWSEYRAERDARQAESIAQAAKSVGDIGREHLLQVGAMIYWCEGTKAKPWNASRRIVFVNSDPGLILVFLAFLRALDVAEDRLLFRVHIHETADVDAAVASWADTVGVARDTFQPTSLKRHNPRTVRHNTGSSYRGCLVITVRRSRQIYNLIEGLVRGTVDASVRAFGSRDPGHADAGPTMGG